MTYRNFEISICYALACATWLALVACGPWISPTGVNGPLKAELVRRLADTDSLPTLLVDADQNFWSWFGGGSEDALSAFVAGPMSALGFRVVGGSNPPREYVLAVNLRQFRMSGREKVEVAVRLSKFVETNARYHRGYTEDVTSFVVTNDVFRLSDRTVVVQDALSTAVNKLVDLISQPRTYAKVLGPE